MLISEIWHADTKYLHRSVLKIGNSYDLLYTYFNFSHGLTYPIAQISKKSMLVAKKANPSSFINMYYMQQ